MWYGNCGEMFLIWVVMWLNYIDGDGVVKEFVRIVERVLEFVRRVGLWNKLVIFIWIIILIK